MAQEAQEPRLKKYKNKWYIYYREKNRSQRVSTWTDDLEVATIRFQGWLKESKINYEVIKDPTIEECLELWFDQWIAGRMLSENRYTAIINNLNAFFGKMTVSEVNRSHSIKYIELRANGLIGSKKGASGTIRGELQRLRACLRFMRERVEPKEQRISKDVCPYVELPLPSPPRDRVLSEDEVSLLRETCSSLVINGRGRKPSNRMSRVGRFIIIAMETAQRKKAIEELLWEQVDFDKNLIYFNPEGRLQTIKKRSVLPMGSRLRPVMEQAKQEAINKYVLDKDTSLYDAVVSLGKKLNIDGLHPHVFRHTWATRAVTRGVALKKVAMYLGDSEKTVRDNYEHLSPNYLLDATEE